MQAQQATCVELGFLEKVETERLASKYFPCKVRWS